MALHRALGGSKVLTSEEGCQRFSADESDQEPVLPDAVVLAESADDVVRTLAVASELGVPVTPRSAGTGKSGGAVPVCGGVVLSTLGMNKLCDIDRREQVAVVQPGLVLAELHHAVEAEGLFYPPDPNSNETCALGGNLAENAGGPRAFKYGVTRDYVLGLEVVTAQGARLRTGRPTVKGVTGYDVTSLLVGSEGTLAVTLQARLRLIPKPEQVVTLLAWFATVGDAAAAVSDVVASGTTPRCMELLDSACLEAMRREGVPVREGAGAMLLIEVDGPEPLCERDMQKVGALAEAAHALEVVVAQSDTQRSKLWATRRELTNVVKKLAKHKIGEDVVVPRCRMRQLMDEIALIGERHALRTFAYGHAGDGNLHVNVLWNEDEEVARVRATLHDVMHAVIAMDGALTGEHGIGSSKAEYLPLEHGPELRQLEQAIKAQFDPQGILNPGKIFPRQGHGAC